jgi:hypothetical protein
MSLEALAPSLFCINGVVVIAYHHGPQQFTVIRRVQDHPRLKPNMNGTERDTSDTTRVMG